MLRRRTSSRAGQHSEAGRKTLADLVATAVGHLDHHLRFLFAKRSALGLALIPHYSDDATVSHAGNPQRHDPPVCRYALGPPADLRAMRPARGRMRLPSGRRSSPTARPRDPDCAASASRSEPGGRSSPSWPTLIPKATTSPRSPSGSRPGAGRVERSRTAGSSFKGTTSTPPRGYSRRLATRCDATIEHARSETFARLDLTLQDRTLVLIMLMTT